jgi:hypothetical protein
VNLSAWPTLALVLFAPWFLILSALYWWYPRQPRTPARRVFDGMALLLAYAGCIAALYWSMGFADRSYGALWPQILATSVGYGVFLAVLTVAWYLRRRMLARA